MNQYVFGFRLARHSWNSSFLAYLHQVFAGISVCKPATFAEGAGIEPINLEALKQAWASQHDSIAESSSPVFCGGGNVFWASWSNSALGQVPISRARVSTLGSKTNTTLSHCRTTKSAHLCFWTEVANMVSQNFGSPTTIRVRVAVNEDSLPHIQQHWGKLHVISPLEELHAAIIAIARDIRKGQAGLKKEWRLKVLSSPMEFEFVPVRRVFWRAAELRETLQTQAESHKLTFVQNSSKSLRVVAELIN
jgi:hypothetical protein